jgi:HAMP domain-containing protein
MPANEIRATAYFAVTVSAALAVLGFCWSMIVVVYPLNRLARMGRRTLAGERDVVFYPQRADEIGTIASCLELSRWYRAAGRRPSSTGRRPVGAATDLTVVIPRIRPTHPAVHR